LLSADASITLWLSQKKKGILEPLVVGIFEKEKHKENVQHNIINPRTFRSNNLVQFSENNSISRI
jgi:hypothetical protein